MRPAELLALGYFVCFFVLSLALRRTRAGWLMAVAASGDAVTIVSSNDPALLPVALKSAGGS